MSNIDNQEILRWFTNSKESNRYYDPRGNKHSNPGKSQKSQTGNRKKYFRLKLIYGLFFRERLYSYLPSNL